MSAGSAEFETAVEGLKTVLVAGRRLQVRLIGGPKRGAPCLVFLHEGLGSISQWRDFPAALAKELDLPAIVYDRQGHGGSDPVTLPRPANFLETEGEQVLPALLEAVGVDRPILVGHSDGGTAALYFAAAFPERPLAAVTIAAHVLLEQETLKALAEVTERWRDDAEFRKRLARHHGRNAESMFRGWSETWQRPELAGWSMVERLGSIRCPLLALQGADDLHGTSRQLLLIRERASGPVETEFVAGAGHAPHLEARDSVLARIAAFVRSVL